MWTDSFRSRYVRSLEQQIVELKAEKAEQRAEIERLQRLLVPGLRQMDREEKQHILGIKSGSNVAGIMESLRTQRGATEDSAKGKVERLPPVTGWIQARDRAEHLSQPQ